MLPELEAELRFEAKVPDDIEIVVAVEWYDYEGKWHRHTIDE
jgi:hypothetical protein